MLCNLGLNSVLIPLTVHAETPTGSGHHIPARVLTFTHICAPMAVRTRQRQPRHQPLNPKAEQFQIQNMLRQKYYSRLLGDDVNYLEQSNSYSA
eukprot:4346171-Amphidinium_carterae.1